MGLYYGEQENDDMLIEQEQEHENYKYGTKKEPSSTPKRKRRKADPNDPTRWTDGTKRKIKKKKVLYSKYFQKTFKN